MNRLFSSNNITGKLALSSLFKDIRESISGTEFDFTNGKLGKAILLLSIPMVLEMVMESIFAVADIYFVSRLGPEAVATVGITESLITIIYALGVGLSAGTTALVSRRIGEKNKEEAAKTAVQAIYTGLVISFVIAIPGIIFASRLLSMMGASVIIVHELSAYTVIMLGGNAVIMLLFIINAVFRSAGDANISMRVLFIANLLNIILDPCLIFGLGPFPEMGIAGAAIASNLGRGFAIVYQFYILFKGKSRIHLKIKHLKVEWGIIRKLVSVSMGGIGQYLIATSSWIGLVRIISVFGSEVLAGYTIALRIIIFAILPSFGVSNATATLVGQNLGAEKPDRAEKSVWITAVVNMVLLGIISVFLLVFPAFFVELFIHDRAVIRAGVICLQIISGGFIMYGFGMVLVNSFNGAGDTKTPSIINFFCFWLLEIPLAYFLAITMGMEEKGVFISILVSESVMTLTAYFLFRQGKWKQKII